MFRSTGFDSFRLKDGYGYSGNDKLVQTKGWAGRRGRLPDGSDLKAKQVLES